MSINNIQTNYTNLINPLITRYVITTAKLDTGILSAGSSVDCSGIFGAGDLIANIECINNTTDLIITANGNDPDKNGIITTIPPGLAINGGILFSIPLFGFSSISNNLVSVGGITDFSSQDSRAYTQFGNMYPISNTTSLFTDSSNDDTYTYIAGGIQAQHG